jgi:hypothetical protein
VISVNDVFEFEASKYKYPHSHLTLLLKKRKKKKEKEKGGRGGEETIPIRAAHTVSLYLNPVPLIGSSTNAITAIIHISVRCPSN